MTAVRIGGGQAGYGDSIEPIADLLAAGIDYLVCDALAESTLAVLQKDRQRDEGLGYTRDLPHYVSAVVPALADGRTKLITNAGGLNPIAATAVVVETLRAAGLDGTRVATVVGDDVRRLMGDRLPGDVVFANAYLGARPVVEALGQGAQVVITGRVADASLFLAPLLFEHGWAFDDLERVAAGLTVGHLLECSSQVTGSVFSGAWWEDPAPLRPGFPIAEVEPCGAATITKPPGTGGRVDFDTVREQLLYEVHDPAAYLNPDGTVDLTTVRLDDLGDDRVRVVGATGRPAPLRYKVLSARPHGWSMEVVTGYAWPDAEAKARAMVSGLQARVAERQLAVEEWCVELFGAGAYHGAAAAEDLAEAERAGWEPPEVVARVAWRCGDEDTARRVAACRRTLPTPAMSAPFGRPKRRRPSQLFQLHALDIDRSEVDPMVAVSVTDV